jgi:short-subunit dehydrogenase
MIITGKTKTIFITGAGSGIGAAIARLFSSKGWYTGLYDLNENAVKLLADELGDNCCYGSMNVADWNSVRQAISDFSEHTNGQMSVLCNNAGLFEDCPLVDSNNDYLQKMMRVNMDGVVATTKSAFPLLHATANAKVINIASAASIYGVPNEAVYSASKFFVRGFSEAISLEWKNYGIEVSVVMPSYVRTPMIENKSISWSSDFGVKLGAEDVAATVWKACHSRKQYWCQPFSARLLFGLIRVVPLQGLRFVAAKLFKV